MMVALRNTYVILAALSILFFANRSQGHVISAHSNGVRQQVPGVSNKPLCRSIRTIRFVSCFCFLTVSKRLNLKGRHLIVKRCTQLFGKFILTFAKACNPFKEKGKLNPRKLVATANRLRKVCLPRAPPILLKE